MRRIIEEERIMKLKLEEQKRVKQQQHHQQQQHIILQQQQQRQRQQEEERRRKQMAANAIKVKEVAPPLPARVLAEDIINNDPWFQNQADLSNNPIYQNTLPPLKLDMSMDTTTEEIDIDAVLGYEDIVEEPELEHEQEFDHQPGIRRIEEIIWPKSEPEPPEEDVNEGDTSSQGKGSGKKKPGLFNFGGKKKSRRSDSPVHFDPEPEPEPVLAAEYYDEDKMVKHEKKKFWSKKGKGKQPQQQQQHPLVDDDEMEVQAPPEEFVEEFEQRQKPEKKKFFGSKKSKTKPVPQNFEEDEDRIGANDEVVEEVRKLKPEGEKKSIWSLKKPKQQQPSKRSVPPQQQEEPEPEEEIIDEYQDEVPEEPKPSKQKAPKKSFWPVKKPKPQPVYRSETEEEDHELPPPVELDSQEDEVQELSNLPEPDFDPPEFEQLPEPEAEIKQVFDIPMPELKQVPQPEPEFDGRVIDVVAVALEQDSEVDQIDQDYTDEEPVEQKKTSQKRGLGAFFHKPTLKGLTGSKKPSQSSKKPGQVGNIPPVDVSHLLEDDFGFEETLPSPTMTSGDEAQQPQTQTDTELSDNNATEPQATETSDEGPRETVQTKKSKFSLKINLKKDNKPEKEEKAERPKPAKFFKSPSFKSPSRNRTPKTSPESKNVRQDERSPERDSSAERPQEPQKRPQHYSPPKVEVIEHQVDSLNEGENDSYIEPAPVQVTDDDDERRESTTADEAKFTSDETGNEDDQEKVVHLPVEMDEPEPTEPIRGRPKTTRKKSVGSGFAGLFSSSRPSSRTRSGKREQDIEREPEGETAAPETEEQERPFENRRRSDSKGLGGLFASKRNKPRRPRPVSGPPAGAARDDEAQRDEFKPEPEQETQEEPTRLLRKQRSTGLSGFLFSSRRGPSAKSTGNLADRKRDREEDSVPPPPPPPEHDDRPSYNNSTTSLNRQKREKGFGAMFGAPKTRMSGRKPMPRSTTFPLAQQTQQPQPQQDSEDDVLEQHQQQQQHKPQLEPSPRQPRVQQSPRPSERSSEDQRPPLPLPAEAANQYSPTPKQQDQMVYDQIEIVNEDPTPPRSQQYLQQPEAPRDPNRQLGRRSGRFRRPHDGDTSINSLDNSRQISATSMTTTTTPPKPETTQGMMRDLFAEKVVRRPPSSAAQNAGSRMSAEDSTAASSLGADFEYEKAMRGGSGGEARSRSANKRNAGGTVGRTESYRQAHNAGPAPAAPKDQKPQNYNSLPRLGKQRRPMSARRAPQGQQQQQEQQQQQQQQDPDENYDSRSLGDRPRSRSARQEDPCSVM